MVSTALGAAGLLAAAFLALALPVAAVWLLVRLFQGLVWLVRGLFRALLGILGHLGRFVRGTLLDALGVVGGVLTAVFLVPLALFNVLMGRWSAAGHYGRALEDEITSSGLSLYRLVLGNPIRLLGLSRVTDGLERRLPDVVARAPRGDRPRGKKRAFPGYEVVGSLRSGGSGGRLFLATPRKEKQEHLAAHGSVGPAKVVIKAFDLADGSTLPQIVRESRALASAKRLGLVLDHELSSTRFYYVMPYVPGDDLAVVARRLHDRSGPAGLGDGELELAMGYVGDLLQTLERFHAFGLWHKDIKPTNVIVSGGRAHLVDLGLVTPLASAMTLTTHGTEYFRDPEMVRLAMRGVRVHEVDGVKFDIYSAGALLFSLLENSFPAHGSLSRIEKRCPSALQWVVHRAMADLEKRYGSAREMLADLRAIARARDPFTVRPADLPSVRGELEGPPAGDLAARAGEPRGQGDWIARQVAAARAGAAPAVAGAGAEDGFSVGTGAVRGTGAEAGSRRRRRGVVGALVLVGGFFALLAVTASLFLGVRHQRAGAFTYEVWPPASEGVALTPFEWELRRRIRAWDGEPGIWSGSDSVSRTVTVGPSPFGPDAARAPRSVAVAQAPPVPAAPAPPALPSGGTVLLLDDLPAGVDRASLLEELVAVLRQERVRVLAGSEPIPGADRAAVEVEAGARRALGVGTPQDPATLERLRAFVSVAPEVDAVLWLVPGERAGRFGYRLVAGERPAIAEPPAGTVESSDAATARRLRSAALTPALSAD